MLTRQSMACHQCTNGISYTCATSDTALTTPTSPPRGHSFKKQTFKPWAWMAAAKTGWAPISSTVARPPEALRLSSALFGALRGSSAVSRNAVHSGRSIHCKAISAHLQVQSRGRPSLDSESRRARLRASANFTGLRCQRCQWP